jgi:hypothetical protein
MSQPVRRSPHRRTVLARKQTKRIDVELALTDIDIIRTVAALTGETTFMAVVRDALKAYAWMVMEQHRDRRIISEARMGGDRVEMMPLVRISEPSAVNQ